MDTQSFEKVLLERQLINKSKGVRENKPKHHCVCGYKARQKANMNRHQAICCIHKEAKPEK